MAILTTHLLRLSFLRFTRKGILGSRCIHKDTALELSSPSVITMDNSYPGPNATQFHFAQSPALLPVKTNLDSGGIQELSLKNLLETRCSSLFIPFQPPWRLFNGHLQTLYNVYEKSRHRSSMVSTPTYSLNRWGNTLFRGLDFVQTDSTSHNNDTPIIVVTHGLTGGSFENYIRAVLAPACKPADEGGLGYRAVVVTSRGCAGVPITSPRLYTAGHTDDLRQALLYLRTKYPNAPLLGLGFSLGANVMTRYVEEEGENSRLSSVCVLSCPWDMQKNGYGLVSTFLGKNLYSRGMGRNLVKLVRRHKHSFRQFPDHPLSKELPAVLATKMPTLHHFDDTFTRKVGGEPPTFPIATIDDYYRWASSDKLVENIRVPFLAINSADDPVVTSTPMDGKGNGLVTMVLTHKGGHLGWFQTQSGNASVIERWSTKPILEWLRLNGNDLVQPTSPRGKTAHIDEEGFIREEGRMDIGCKEIAGSILIDGNAGEPKLHRF